MLAKIESMAIFGITAYRVDVEVDISSGIPSFTIVGLPDTACRESSKRVMAAIKNSGYKLPSLHITVNLAPAYLKKEGSMYELAIALGILAATGNVDKALLENRVICGELSLDGSLRAIRGALSIADELRCHKDKELIIPSKNYPEVASLNNLKVIAVRTLNETVSHIVEGIMPERPTIKRKLSAGFADNMLDYSDIKGNSHAKRAMEIAAAGGHNILLIGPPGTGKSMLAMRIPTIMDELNEEEAIQTSKIYSICGLLDKEGGLIKMPPFRSLHHSASDTGTIGGGTNYSIRPGEISLAHNGVLFLDELPEFRRDVLEALRQPLEEGTIRISRTNISVCYPAEFMLVAAMNPCPCGFLTHPQKACSCTPPQVQRYLSKISGPLLDRIDLHIEVQPIRYEQMRQTSAAKESSLIKARVKKARDIQKIRYKDYTYKLNAKLTHNLVAKLCPITDKAQELLKKAMSELFLSGRAYDKILKVARTIADLEEKPIIDIEDISEAISYRTLDTKIWP